MLISLYLAKVIGITMLFIALLFIMKRKAFASMVDMATKNKNLLIFASFFEFVLALLLLTGHWVWEGWPVIITLFGVLMLFESLFYIFASRRSIEKLIKWALKPNIVAGMTVIMLVFGIYLVVAGFTF